MQKININVQGITVDFNLARQMGDLLAERENQQCMLISWCDAQQKRHSPQGVHCEIKGEAGWEVYGRNHGGRLRLSFNNDALVLIYS